MLLEFLERIANRAGTLSVMTRRELIDAHPDNEDNQPYSSQWRGKDKSQLISEIIYDEFADDIEAFPPLAEF